MTRNNEYTRAGNEDKPYLPTIRKKVKEIAEELPPNQLIPVSELIPTLNLVNGSVPIGYMALHGVSPPGFSIFGTAFKRQNNEAGSEDNFVVYLDLAYN